MQDTTATLSNAFVRAAVVVLALAGVLCLLSPEFIARVLEWAWPGGSRGSISICAREPDAALLEKSPDAPEVAYPLNVRVVDTADLAMESVRKGNDEAGIAPSLLFGGTSGFEGVASLGRLYLHVAAPSGSPIKTVRDLASRKIGLAGGDPAVRLLIDRVFDFYGLDIAPQFVEQHNPDLEKAFLDGEIDAAALLTGLFDPALSQLLATGWYDLIPLPEAEALAGWLPGVVAVVFPAGVYGAERTRPDPAAVPVTTLAVSRVLFARRDVPETAVRVLLDRLESALPAGRVSISDANLAEVAPLRLNVLAARILAGVEESAAESNATGVWVFGVCSLLAVAGAVIRQRVNNRRISRRREFAERLQGVADIAAALNAPVDPASLPQLAEMLEAQRNVLEHERRAGRMEPSLYTHLALLQSLTAQSVEQRGMALRLSETRKALAALARRWDRALAETDGVNASSDTSLAEDAPEPVQVGPSVSIFAPDPPSQEDAVQPHTTLTRAVDSLDANDSAVLGRPVARTARAPAPPAAVQPPSEPVELEPDVEPDTGKDQMTFLF